MLEEFRVSLWAQQLGTAGPVSDQRIRKALGRLRRLSVTTPAEVVHPLGPRADGPSRPTAPTTARWRAGRATSTSSRAAPTRRW